MASWGTEGHRSYVGVSVGVLDFAALRADLLLRGGRAAVGSAQQLKGMVRSGGFDMVIEW